MYHENCDFLHGECWKAPSLSLVIDYKEGRMQGNIFGPFQGDQLT